MSYAKSYLSRRNPIAMTSDMEKGPTDTDDARANLDRLIRERGETYGGISKLLGRNAAYIQQFVKRGSPRKLDALFLVLLLSTPLLLRFHSSSLFASQSLLFVPF